GGVLYELKSRASIDGIIQPAGGAHHWYRPVLQAVDLVQAARLVAAGHEEDVGACFYAVSQHVIEPDSGRDPSRKLLLHPAEEILVLGFTGAERDQIGVQRDDVGGGLGDQVGSFLSGEAG